MLVVPRHILAATFEQFRDHGRGEIECVVYWIGPAGEKDRVDEFVHPVHTSHLGGYQVDDRWLTEFWLDLAKRRKSVRAQVHTHPHEAFHSKSDDTWALLPDIGFLSLVIPDFALGPVGLERAFLAERNAEGGWSSPAPEQRIKIL